MLRRLFACRRTTPLSRVEPCSIHNRYSSFQYSSRMGGVLSYLPFNYSTLSPAQRSNSPGVTGRNSHAGNGTTIDATKAVQETYPKSELEETSIQKSSRGSGSDNGDDSDGSVIELGDDTLIRRSHDLPPTRSKLAPNSELKNYWNGEEYIVTERGPVLCDPDTGEIVDLKAMLRKELAKGRPENPNPAWLSKPTPASAFNEWYRKEMESSGSEEEESDEESDEEDSDEEKDGKRLIRIG